MTLVLGVHAYLMRSACVQRGLKQGRFRCSVDNLEVSARQLTLWINSYPALAPIRYISQEPMLNRASFFWPSLSNN